MNGRTKTNPGDTEENQMDGSKKILVTGATGHQGGAIANELLGKQASIRVMTRHPESPKARALAARGAEVVAGDLDDAASVEKALHGVWGAFAVQNTWEAGVKKEEEQGKRFATLAKKAGVQHLVYSSVASAQRKTGIPHFDNKWRVEETIRGLGFPSTVILRPVFFMENFLLPSILPGIQQGTLAFGIEPDTVLQMIAVKDIGRHGARAFEQASELNGRAIDLAGDQLTMPEVVKVLSEASRQKVAFFRVPTAEIRKFSEDYAAMVEWFDRVGYDVDIEGLAKETGVRPTKFADWAKTIDWAEQPAAR